MTKLSVNINKVALIRNSRGGNIPDILQVAKDIQELGAQGITVHPRPDQRHIRYDDLPLLKSCITTEFNIEGFPSKKFIDAVIDCKPHQVTLVPDKPYALTSDNGWDTIVNKSMLKEVVDELKTNNIRTSLFINPDLAMIDGAKQVNTDRIEFYTGPYAANYQKQKDQAVLPFIEAANHCNSIQLGINAGHDLNLENLHFFKSKIPLLLEVSIGHALISDALYFGFSNVVQMYLHELNR